MAANVHLIFGDEYLVSKKAKTLIESLVPAESRTFGLEIIDGAVDNVDSAIGAVKQCLEAVLTVGFMGSGKVVWFRNVSFLHDSVVGRNPFVKESVERLAALIKGGIQAGSSIVISSPKVDKRYALYKACRADGDIEEFSIPDKPNKVEEQAARIACDVFGEAGLKFDEQVLDAFLVKVGTDTRQIVNEIEKIAVFLGGRKEVKVEDVEAVVSSSREMLAWDLADAFGKRDLKRSIKILKQLMFQKESAVGIIIALENRIRELMLYREAIDSGWISGGGYASWRVLPPAVERVFTDDFEKDPRKAHPYRMGLLAEQAKGFPARQLQKCRKIVMDAHEKLVSSGVPEQTVIELALVRMLS